MKTLSVSAYSIFRKRFSTRAEPSILKQLPLPPGGSGDSLEVFGDEVAFVAYGFSETFRRVLEKGVVASWKFLSTGDIACVNSEDLNITLDYPELGDVSFYTRLLKAHFNSTAILSVVEECGGDVLYTFPEIFCREMQSVSNVLAVCNPLADQLSPPGGFTDRVYATSSPRVCLQVFPSPLEAYKACCRMQQEIRKLKSGRIRMPGGLSGLHEDVIAYSYQRPILLTHEAAKKLCVSKKFQELKELQLLPAQLCVPKLADVCLFQEMWQKG